MVGQHIPAVLVTFSVLAAYRIFGIGDYIYDITHKELQSKYDYVISKLIKDLNTRRNKLNLDVSNRLFHEHKSNLKTSLNYFNLLLYYY